MVVERQNTPETQGLRDIFGYQPVFHHVYYNKETVYLETGIEKLSGTFYEIIGNTSAYKVSPSQFSRKVRNLRIKGDGLFEGPWNEIGKKLASLYFHDHDEGAVIYFNNKKCHLWKKLDGTVAFKKDKFHWPLG